MAGSESAEGNRNDEEETMGATTPMGPATVVDLSQAPKEADNPDIAKEKITPETINATDATDTEAANDTTSEEVETLNDNDDALLGCLSSDVANAKENNPEEDEEQSGLTAPTDSIRQRAKSSENFDLLGAPQGESTNPSPDVGDVFVAASQLFDNGSTDEILETDVDPKSIHDPSGVKCGQNARSNNVPVQQLRSSLVGSMSLEPHHSPTEKKEEVEECAASQKGNSVTNAVGSDASSLERLESSGECNKSEEVVNHSEIEITVPTNEGNSVDDEQARPPPQKEGGASISSKEEDTVIGLASLGNNEATSQSIPVLDGVNQSDIECDVTTNDDTNSSKLQGEQGIDQVENEVGFRPIYASLLMETAPSLEAVSQHGVKNKEMTKSESNGNASAEHDANGGADERTEEEEEWLSMGLGLGDALRQIVALTEERDSALSMCQEKEDGKVQTEAFLVEVQSCLEGEMNRRAESESEVQSVRSTLKSFEERLKAYERMEDDLETAQANLVTVVSEKSKIELEVQKLREMRDASEQKEAVLSNRLNEAKKKEANKSSAAGRLEADNENLRDDLRRTKDELESTAKAKAKLESNMEKLKAKAVERVKQAETALSEERELNEERKKKMKIFVETKAEELREAKEGVNDMQKELEETRASLRSSRDREETFQKELEAARIKYRELQRDMDRMKRNSEQLHRVGNNLEQELEKSANETEEHKKKRMSAKHEIMQMVRTLEAERAVSAKLRESVKFTFTPKALSQQELLNECLRDFQAELERLAAKMGKTLLPTESNEQVHNASEGAETPGINGSSRKSRKTRASKADMDTERLVSNLETETQHVSKGIMALAGSIERMRSLLDEDYGCMTFFSNVLAGAGEARHQRLGDSEHEENNSDQFV